MDAKKQQTWMVVMNTIPAKVLGCEKESLDPFFPLPCGDEPRSQAHLVLDKAVNQRQRLCFKLLAAEKKVPPSGVHQRKGPEDQLVGGLEHQFYFPIYLE